MFHYLKKKDSNCVKMGKNKGSAGRKETTLKQDKEGQAVVD